MDYKLATDTLTLIPTVIILFTITSIFIYDKIFVKPVRKVTEERQKLLQKLDTNIALIEQRTILIHEALKDHIKSDSKS